MLVRASDLTTYARIRNAALEGFAERGVAGTTIRDVAQAAGVSAGLVQHHFGTKAALRAAVDEYVGEIVASSFEGFDATGAEEPLRDLGDRITALVRDHPTALLYVARSVADGDEASLALFDAFVEVSRAQWQRLSDDGRLHPGTDVDWAALHVVIFNLATVLFEAAVSRRLGEPFNSARQLQRWNEATADLFRRGTYRPRAS